MENDISKQAVITMELVKSRKNWRKDIYIIAPRHRIGRIMHQETYTTAQFRPQRDTCNEAKTANIIARKLDERPYRNVVVSDLTYVRVGMN